MRVGQVNQPLRIPISPILVDAPTTTLTVNTASGVSTLSVSNSSQLAAGFPLLIGEPGNQTSEIVTLSSITDINTIVLTGTTQFPHSASTKIYSFIFTDIEISNATTVTGTKTVVAGISITSGVTTDYTDIVSTGGYYFARYYESIIGEVTSVSAGADGAGYLVDDVLTLGGGDGTATVKVTGIDGGGAVTSVSIVNAGNSYVVGPIPTFGGTGDGNATITVSTVNFYSPYSDPVPYGGYTIRSARSVIDSALNEINKEESQTLTDEFAFQQLDTCQSEVIQDLKRWSFMQKFDQIVADVTTGSWKFTMPDDIGVDYTNKSVYQVRVGTQQRLVWVDKEKFDEFLVGVAYNTLAIAAVNTDTTLTLVDSSDFTDTGMVTIGANTYSYTANNTSTGVLTLSAAITPSTVAALGADVFQGATSGLPQYWTTYGGMGYYWPITASTYNGRNLYMDYYSKQLPITSDSDMLVFPDPTVAISYLCWKFLKKLANGEETAGSTSYMNQYLARKEKMRVKEVMNRTFKFRPRIQNFAVQSEFNESTPRWVRDANFPSTGF